MSYFTKRYHPPGTAPGTLVEAPEAHADGLQVLLMDYSADGFTMKEDADIAECRDYLQSDTVTWVHVQGKPTLASLQELADFFHLHALALEDVLNSGQRPKVEPFDDQLFLVMMLPSIQDNKVTVEQVSFFLSRNVLVSFCEGSLEPFRPVVKRLQDKGSRMRSRGADYLLYSLLDTIIDQGFPVLESFGMQLEALEEKILNQAEPDTLQEIHMLKRELILLRRMLWPQREVMSQLMRDDSALIHSTTLIYLRDCYDHTVQVMDLLETYREMSASMLDIYLSSISNRMNDVMRLLTVISTIFIPLTFIVGVYGMNFDRHAGPWSMPELGWPYGYVLVWGGMIMIAVLMMAFFKRRGWF